MLMAAIFTGIRFRNAGVVKRFKIFMRCFIITFYSVSWLELTHQWRKTSTLVTKFNQPIVPRGVSDALTASSVFHFATSACSNCHIDTSAAFGTNPACIRPSTVGVSVGQKTDSFP
ncbi:hypothetical protein BJV82DRAFT_695537 [Fennellomyces sp. T-0311]|nr:hypothetical protein BJV82DRAFT_695537 [Fennellomyces sp. T-0311]